MLSKGRGILALFLAASLSGSFGVLSHYISFSVPLFYQMLIRNVTQLAIIIGLMCFIKGWEKPIARKDIKWFTLRSASGFANCIGLYVAFTQVAIGTVYFLSFAASTICGYMMGSLLFKERLGVRGLTALTLSIVGLGLVYSVSFEVSTIWYSIAAIAAGIAAPGWSVFSKALSRSYSNLQMNFVDTLLAVIFSLLMTLGLKEQWVSIQANSLWFAIFGISLIFLVAGFLIVYGFRYVTAEAGTLILLFEIVAGIALGYLFLRQTVPLRSLIGGLLILTAIILQTYSSSKILHRTRHTHGH